ncbi:hypothetical protein [Sulfuricurvum sp.]|uniref:hypothetical protein n=1 Tax=Sulfuricurvum sp. TaxID=2025608 RepID=UPI003BB702BC
MSITYTTAVFQSKVIDPDTKAFIKNVDSKYLFDKSGNPVMDPTTGNPYIVPADMNFDQMVINLTDKYNTNIGTAPIDSTKILLDFRSVGGTNDLQRMDVNGQPYGGFVSDYTSAASLYFGAVSAGLKITLSQTEMGGGALNFLNSLKNPTLNTSGDYYNNPKNIDNMTVGYHYYQNNIATNETVNARVNAIDIFHDLVHDTFGKIGDFYIGTPVQKIVQILNVGLSNVEKIAYEAFGISIVDPTPTGTSYKDTTVITLTPNTNSTNITYDTYSPTGAKTSSTISAYSNTGDLIGRTTSQHQTGDFITLPSATSPVSTLNALQQAQAKNETLAQDAFAVAKFVGLDKNSATSSEWINTINTPTTTGGNSVNIPYTPIINYTDTTYFNNKNTRRVA